MCREGCVGVRDTGTKGLLPSQAPTCELRLSIGGLAFGLQFRDSDSDLRLNTEKLLGCYRSQNSQLPIFINMGTGEIASASSQVFRDAQLVWAGDRWHFDGIAHAFEIQLLMRRTLALLLVEHCGFLLHASSVLDDGNAYVFMGPSGTGKSTLAELSLPRPILSDEVSLVRISEDAVCCYSTPFWGSWGQGRLDTINESAPVAALFVLEHAQENRLERLSQAEAVTHMLKNAQLLDSKSRLDKCLRNAQKMTSKVPVFRLFFRPEHAVWETIRRAREMRCL